MNPLHWTREHQVAWVLTAVLGAMLGIVASVTFFPGTGQALIVSNEFWDEYAAGSVLAAFKVGATGGAAFAALAFYTVKLIAIGRSN